MAYLHVEQINDVSAGSATRTDVGFGSLEREVVRLSFGDARASVLTPHHVVRISAWLAGRRTKPPLADPRLEALRRYAVLYRLEGDALDRQEKLTVARAGFGDAVLRDIRLMVDRHLAHQPQAAPSRLSTLMAVLTALTLLGGIALLIQQATDDAVISIIVSALLAATTVSFHRPGRSPSRTVGGQLATH